MNPLDELVAHARQGFEEALIRVGFVAQHNHWNGTIAHGETCTKIALTLPPGFPFVPPRVKPAVDDPVPWSWHRELDGALCLVAEDDHHDLWWANTSVFLAHVQAWFENSDAGWVDDRPDLDLERYFRPSTDPRLYLYGELGQYDNAFVRFRPEPNNLMRLSGRGTRPAKTTRKFRDKFGYVADLGFVDRPPRGWADIEARIDPSVDLERQIRDHHLTVLVLTYSRGQHEAAIVLDVFSNEDGGVSVRRLRSAADTPQARSARSGPQAAELGRFSVAVIGVGAIGSFVADLLVRAGVRRLTLVDHDLVTPGNLVRHLVGPEGVGLAKPIAVKNHLTRSNTIAAARITTREVHLTSTDEALALLTGHDLIVNATADFAVTALLHAAAASIGTRIISAALQNGGATFRVDVLPPLDGQPTLAPSAIQPRRDTGPDCYEAGCGSPISPTPPHAVAEAAAATVRHAVGLLLRQPIHPAGEIRHLNAEPTAAA
ncbi:ThiF family adenylyltransferase [Pengzhenrongella sicca]|uniref:ThiF family adenylyltransferase n=1 Tax=Pengzhenrongella sicca TaxID=2819238 RepID=A0A8A4ZM10_9MICO|nr:ThiF family adenylyltransferase [Pengzhenrongella sicca]QTE31536.1 ThiF family adenylyltransferase [Pengzhenrongella sicca]